MDDLERAKQRLAELDKLIEKAEHPGAYVNTLHEEREAVKHSIRLMRSRKDDERYDLGV